MLNAPKTRLVSLPIDFTYPGEDCTLFGWGKESYGSNSFSKRLRYVHLKVMSLADCQSRWSDQRVTIDNLCTGDIAGHGACIGDEGAPLVKNGMQIGMFSFGGMCIDGRPDVYVNVFNYITFINAVAID
ncbi:hypothetical protein RI129_012937 [Pyrocoelia pectoralis]|uniref:Peptidase S1 domain-containing protein n=1 Tax=Pyrocoelia pectoralis TaxID=417401 RepID=A0AAN7ZCM0_9COLE